MNSKTKDSTVSLTKCNSYELKDLRLALDKLLEPFGGIGSFVRPGQRVLLKPNLLSAKSPERAITTHPGLVRVVAEKVIEAGGKPVIGDSPGGAIRGVKRVWEETGIMEMASDARLELVNFETSGIEVVRRGGYDFYLSKAVLDADLIINLAKLKTHTLTLFTGGVKNIFGVIPGFRKSELHKMFPKPREFARMLVELYRLISPSLTIVDGVIAMEGNGPSSGKARKLGLLAAGADAVAVDAVLAGIIGFREGQIDTTQIADETGAGVGSLSKINVVGDGTDLRPVDFILPSNRKLRLIPRPLAKMITPLVWLKLEIARDRCTRCEQCLKSCPVQTIIREEDGLFIDQSGCIQCMCCHELCPEDALDIKFSLLARLFL
ncbi:MAG: DUF362 domain-containing protein [Candidatus Krumholzibacteriota bacterium]|nr:DUF362 domain-containing protein [Candidatus Krumholzibacteriota bacterium]